MTMQQLIAGRAPSGTGAGTVYHSIAAGYRDGSELRTQTNWPVAGVARKLRVTLTALPTAASTITVTLRINEADTAMVVTLDDSELTDTYAASDIALAVGDRVAVKTVNTGTGGGVPTWSFEFEPTSGNESVYSGGQINGSGVTPLYLSILSDGIDQTAANNVAHVVAAGTITSHRVCLHQVPGAGRTAVFTLYLSTDNGATWTAQDGSGGTPDTRVTLTDTVSRVGAATFSLPVSDGDLVISRYDRTAGAAINVYGTRSISWDPSTAGQWMFAGRATGTTTNSATRYIPGASSGGWTSGLTNTSVLAGMTTHTLQDLRVWLSAAPGAAKSYVFDYLLNGSTTPPVGTPTVTISGATDLTGTDASNTLTIVDTDLVSLRAVPSGTPATARSSWVAVGSIGSGGGGGAHFPALTVAL